MKELPNEALQPPTLLPGNTNDNSCCQLAIVESGRTEQLDSNGDLMDLVIDAGDRQ